MMTSTENPFSNLYFSNKHRHLAICFGENMQYSLSYISSIARADLIKLHFASYRSYKCVEKLFFSSAICLPRIEMHLILSGVSPKSLIISLRHCSTGLMVPCSIKQGSNKSDSSCTVLRMYFWMSGRIISANSLKQQLMQRMRWLLNAPCLILNILNSSLILSSGASSFMQFSRVSQCCCLLANNPFNTLPDSSILRMQSLFIMFSLFSFYRSFCRAKILFYSIYIQSLSFFFLSLLCTLLTIRLVFREFRFFYVPSNPSLKQFLSMSATSK